MLSVNVGEDCPVFDGLYEFCQLSGGGSIGLSTSPLYILELLFLSLSQSIQVTPIIESRLL